MWKSGLSLNLSSFIMKRLKTVTERADNGANSVNQNFEKYLACLIYFPFPLDFKSSSKTHLYFQFNRKTEKTKQVIHPSIHHALGNWWLWVKEGYTSWTYNLSFINIAHFSNIYFFVWNSANHSGILKEIANIKLIFFSSSMHAWVFLHRDSQICVHVTFYSFVGKYLNRWINTFVNIMYLSPSFGLKAITFTQWNTHRPCPRLIGWTHPALA